VLELATGKAPYSELAPMQAMYRMVEDPHPPFPGDGGGGDAPAAAAVGEQAGADACPPLAPVLAQFLKRCWVRDPQDRPSAAEMCKHELVAAEFNDMGI
jgi:hypothetical protein